MARKRTVPGSRDHPKKAEQKPDQELSVPEARPFDIVGIGASAGGLEAFREFFEHLPAESGMAFVIVSHLDPTHKGYLPELIGRFTPMTVMEITDGLQVRQNTVYVIPPNAELSILHGNFSLLEPAPHVHGLRMTIDHFFRELAGLVSASKVLQYFGIYAFAIVFDPLDFLAYVSDALLAAVVDIGVIGRFLRHPKA